MQYTQEYFLRLLESPQAVSNSMFSQKKKENNYISWDESEW